MNIFRTASIVSASLIASLSMVIPANQASATTTLQVNSDSVVYPDEVIAAIHLASPATNYSSVYVSPQMLNGTLDGQAVSLFAYCVDILHYSGPGSFEVVPLLNYLGGNVSKYDELAALIAIRAAQVANTPMPRPRRRFGRRCTTVIHTTPPAAISGLITSRTIRH